MQRNVTDTERHYSHARYCKFYTVCLKCLRFWQQLLRDVQTCPGVIGGRGRGALYCLVSGVSCLKISFRNRPVRWKWMQRYRFLRHRDIRRFSYFTAETREIITELIYSYSTSLLISRMYLLHHDMSFNLCVQIGIRLLHSHCHTVYLEKVTWGRYRKHHCESSATLLTQ